MKRVLLKISVLFSVILSSTALSRPPEEAEMQASLALGDDIAGWVAGLDGHPSSLALYAVHAHEPFDADFNGVIESEIIKGLKRRGIGKVTPCGECKTPQVSVQGSDIIVFRGAPDVEAIRKVGKRLPVEALLVAEVYRTKLNLMAHVVMYSNSDAEVLGAERFQVPAVNFTDASVQFLVTFGPGMPLYKTAIAGESTLTTGINVMLLEEMGFAKGGLGLQLISTPSAMLIAATPTLSFRGRLGTSSLAYALMMGVGYGMQGAMRGILGRGAFELFLGSWALMGVEGLYFLGDDASSNPIRTYLGFHIGFALGR